MSLCVKDISKAYRVYDKPQDRLFQALVGNRKKLYKEFWALHEISFELPRGQTLGIVGRNGSGKSTLLQIICGTLTPTTGEITHEGRIGALLELGSGFNPEFTGRENVFLNAAILGLSRTETQERLDSILGFADIGEFIDQPVKTYSSGMTMRLAFAVQAHVEPDILVVDEALAVGDELFQKKCYSQLESLKQQGTSILLVTHSCPQIIQHCDNAILLHKGRMRQFGQPARVTVSYQLLSNATDGEWDQELGPPLSRTGSWQTNDYSDNTGQQSLEGRQENTLLQDQDELRRLATTPTRHFNPSLKPQSTTISESFGAKILDLRILGEDGKPANVIPESEPFSLEFDYKADEPFSRLACGCHIASTSGLRITGQIYPPPGKWIEGIGQEEVWKIRFYFLGGLWPGVYLVGGGIWSDKGDRRFVHRVVDYRALRIVDTGKAGMVGQCSLQSRSAQVTRVR